MRDYITLGPTPCAENCAQVGDENYRMKATLEMDIYMEQLKRMFPESSSHGVSFSKKWFNHDFGTYGEIVAVYDDSNEEASNHAINIENNLPKFWDEISLKELSVNVWGSE